MKLFEFLRHKTNANELCVIREGGWIIDTCWIDYEDLFLVHPKIADKEVKKDEWDYLPVVNENNAKIKIPCHYIDIKEMKQNEKVSYL